jgi:hypothetical protein
VSDISPSAVKVTPALEVALKNADAAQIPVIMRREMLAQGLVREDWDPSYLIPVEQPVTPSSKRFAKTADIAGNKMVFEGDSEIEVERQIGAAYKTAAMLQSPATETRTEQPRDASTGRFTTAEPIISDDEKAALSIQFQLGQITASEYIEKSGAVSDYLEKAGVPLADLQATVADKRNEKITQNWQSATQEFLNSSAGNWWPGGDANMTAIGKVLLEMGAEDSPSAENLRRAAEYLRDNNLLVETPAVAARDREVELSQQISSINDPYTLRDTLQPGSGLFNR